MKGCFWFSSNLVKKLSVVFTFVLFILVSAGYIDFLEVLKRKFCPLRIMNKFYLNNILEFLHCLNQNKSMTCFSHLFRYGHDGIIIITGHHRSPQYIKSCHYSCYKSFIRKYESIITSCKTFYAFYSFKKSEITKRLSTVQ